jgi:predicted permease
MLQVSEIVVPVFFIIGLGFALRRAGLVNDIFYEQTNRLVYYVCLPLLLFYKTGTADFSASFNIRLVITTGSAVGCCFLIAWLYGRWRNYPAPVQGAFCQGSFRGNLAYIGLAIINNAYGDTGLTRAGILLGFLVPVLNFFAILTLVLPRQNQRTDMMEICRQILCNPLIIASLSGIGWSFFQLPIPAVIEHSLSIISGMTLPLALLSIGGSFSLGKLRGDIRKTILATTIKLVLLPLITCLLMLSAGITGLDFAIGLLMAGAPTAVATFIMAGKMGGDEELAGSIVIMATACSAASYTVLLYWLRIYGAQ